MSELAALQTGARHIDVQYTALPNGAQIRYSTRTLHLSWHCISGLQRSMRSRAPCGPALAHRLDDLTHGCY